MSHLEEVERSAMCLDREAVLQLVSALRQYRSAVSRLLSSRYSDGECDGHAMSVFVDSLKEIEDPED